MTLSEVAIRHRSLTSRAGIGTSLVVFVALVAVVVGLLLFKARPVIDSHARATCAIIAEGQTAGGATDAAHSPSTRAVAEAALSANPDLRRAATVTTSPSGPAGLADHRFILVSPWCAVH